MLSVGGAPTPGRRRMEAARGCDQGGPVQKTSPEWAAHTTEGSGGRRPLNRARVAFPGSRAAWGQEAVAGKEAASPPRSLGSRW